MNESNKDPSLKGCTGSGGRNTVTLKIIKTKEKKQTLSVCLSLKLEH